MDGIRLVAFVPEQVDAPAWHEARGQFHNAQREAVGELHGEMFRQHRHEWRAGHDERHLEHVLHADAHVERDVDLPPA